jgi:hypothetical protein
MAAYGNSLLVLLTAVRLRADNQGDVMRNRVAILAITVLLPLTGAATLAAAGQAGADPNNPKVTVAGSVDDCENGESPTKVVVTTSKESQTDKRKTVAQNNDYSVTFKNISTKGRAATATVTCKGDSYEDNFTIKRPAGASTSLDRDIEP